MTRDDESGIAMITAVLASMVVAALSLTAVQLSNHSNDASAYDRARVQAVHAAEAGLDLTLSSMQSSTTGTLPCTSTGTLTGIPARTWSTTVQYFASTGGAVPCPVAANALPGSALVRSTGTVGTGPRSATRIMETLVNLTPTYGGLDKAIFSNQTPSLANNLDVFGNNGNDANFYTNGSFNCWNGFSLQGSLNVQGTISLGNSCSVVVDAWANGAVSMANNTTVGHDLKSSTSSITLSGSAKVGNNATSGTTCTGCTSSRVAGSVVTGSPQPPPPASDFPEIGWEPSEWTGAGWAVQTFAGGSACANAKAYIGTQTPLVDTVVRVAASCGLEWTNNTTIDLRANLAIVTDGALSTVNRVTFRSSVAGVKRSLYLVVPHGTSCASPTGNGTVSFSNNTSLSDDMRFLVYTPCTSAFANTNVGAHGQVYANQVNISNQLKFTYFPMRVPGGGAVSGYTPEMKFRREGA